MDFETYKAHHGELTQEQFDKLPKIRIEQEHREKALRAFLPYWMPDDIQWEQCAKLLVMFPGHENTLWHVMESYLTLGRF